MRSRLLLLAGVLLGCAGLSAQSLYTQRPDDPLAVTLTLQPQGLFAAHGDGVADDTEPLQRAIDHVQETTHHGIVFLPEGRYRLSRTLHVWAGIRLIGYGAHRPVLMLGDHAPGFASGEKPCLLWFTDERPVAGAPVADASEFTFYSAASNLDLDLGQGNPAAVGVRFNVAQHSFLSHMTIQVRGAKAGIEDAGNQVSDLVVEGGDYGVITGKTSPAWQFLVMDSTFRGQRRAAIRTQEAGLTLIRDRFLDTPIGVEIPDGQVEQLYGRDLVLNGVSRAAFKLGNVANAQSELTLENIFCTGVAKLLEGAEALSGQSLLFPGEATMVDHVTLGQTVAADGRAGPVAFQQRQHRMPGSASGFAPELRSDLAALPPMDTWANVHELGVKGDGATDDTAALQHAIETHRALYLPSGFYRLTGSLHLRADTVLIGLHVFSTELVLNDADPAFAGTGTPLPLLVAPRGGHPIVSGLGIATGNGNPRAAGIEWLAGAQSLMDDVSFIRGHSEFNAALEPGAPKPQHPQPMQLDAQVASLWVHDGGGGVFRGIWSHAGTAHAGLLVENTSTPGTVYQMSCEHHMAREVRLHQVENWRFYDLQTEEEKPEGADAVAVELDGAHHVLFANTYMYRVSRNVEPKLAAVVGDGSNDVEFANVRVFSQTRLAFDDAFFDRETQVGVRAHNFTSFQLAGHLQTPAPLPMASVFAPGARLQRLDTGYSNVAGLVADPSGSVYFTDAVHHAMYRWNGTQPKAELLATVEGSPMVLGYAGHGQLLAVENEKAVVAVRTDTGAVVPVQGVEAPKPGTVVLLPTGIHNEFWTLDALLAHKGYVFRVGSNTARRSDLIAEPRLYFYAPESSTGSEFAVMAGGTWRPLLQSTGLQPFAVGQSRLLTSEDNARTSAVQLLANGALSSKPFAERGGTAVVVDAEGNAYLAGDQVFVYNRTGHLLGTLEIPERPSSLVFGGSDGRTLFVGARSSLYAIRVAVPGELPRAF